jgi:hypothetical protein
VRARDEARIVEWALHSYGEMASYPLTLATVGAFHSVCPTRGDALAHAAILSALLGPLLAYIAAIYTMQPEPEAVSAVRNGLFWDLRPGKALDTKSD